MRLSKATFSLFKKGKITMKLTILLLLPAAACFFSCANQSTGNPAGARQAPAALPDRSGLLSVTVTKDGGTPGLAKALDMTHQKLRIAVNHPDAALDTTFTLSTSVIGNKILRNVPVGRDVEIIAGIYSADDTLTHQGSALADVLAGDTTFVQIQTTARFGYLNITIYEVPSNVDSGYVKISGTGVTTFYVSLAIDSLARDTAREYDGLATGLIEYIPIGTNRRLDLYLLKENGETAYDGTLTLDIAADSNAAGKIILDPRAAKLRVSVIEPDFDTTEVVGSVLEDGRPETGTIIFSEINYNSTSTDNNEWVELYNTSAAAVDLAPYGLCIGSDTFALSGTVAALGYFVVGESDSSYVDLKLGAVNIPNSGETEIALYRLSADSLADRVRLKYKAMEGWPTSTNGASIELDKSCLDAFSNNYGVFWSKAQDTIPASSPPEIGTPGM
jgi:hypothetical protein